MTDAEAALWSRLRAGRFGATFSRQMPVGRYRADFGSQDARLVIEIDGGASDPARGSDYARTVAMESAGFLVLRFAEADVLGDTDAVADEIIRAIAAAGAGG